MYIKQREQNRKAIFDLIQKRNHAFGTDFFVKKKNLPLKYFFQVMTSFQVAKFSILNTIKLI